MVWTKQKQKTLRSAGKNTHKNCIKKGLSDPDNHSGVVTHLEPDILECEVTWTLFITMNKASGDDGIPVELFQILKDDAVKMPCSIRQQIYKNRQWPQNWKRSGSFQSQRKTMSKNVQSATQLYSFHMLTRLGSKSFKVGFSSIWINNVWM